MTHVTRVRRWGLYMVAVCLLLLTLTLVACGSGSTTNQSSTNTQNQAGTNTPSATVMPTTDPNNHPAQVQDGDQTVQSLLQSADNVKNDAATPQSNKDDDQQP